VTHETDKVKRPASQYYWGDWFKDLALQSCSLPARGLWHEMNCLMHQGEPYGHLTMPNGKPMGPQQLANLCKISPALCKKLVQELEGNGVFSRTSDGTIFSRRMVRDEAIRQARAEGGKAGAEHGVKGADAGKKGGRPTGSEGGSETPLAPSPKPPPSSASSSAASPSGKDQGADAPLSPDEPGDESGGEFLTLTGLADESLPMVPPCPHRKLLAMFAQKVPELPQPRAELWAEGTGADAMRQRWKWLLSADAVREDGTRYATTSAEALDWFGRFFDAVAASDFLTGRSGSWGNCDLGWLMKRDNFVKVVQGNYANKNRERA
jgi:hypothetical protein